MTKARFQGWKNRFHLLLAGVGKSYSTAYAYRDGISCDPFLQTIFHTLLRVLNLFCREGGSKSVLRESNQGVI